MKRLILPVIILTAMALSSCGQSRAPETLSNIPLINFTAQTESEDGIPEYYIFDDNPEHLNPRFLADGENPSLIAHFEGLTPGIYTVFSYHHRGDSVDGSADLYFDVSFTSPDNGKFEILNLGLDNNWDWNQAWADYTNTSVAMPEYISTFFCDCADCVDHTQGVCDMSDCKAFIHSEHRDPRTSSFSGLNAPTVAAEQPLLLSTLLPHITATDVNHFRYGGYDEPMWLIMKFRVISGTVTFDTLAYQNKDTALANFATLKKGPWDNEPQYKGIAKNAPIVTTEFDYEISDETQSGAVPVMVKNMRVPEGYVIENGMFATNVNTWREELPIAAESDLMLLEYRDEEKLMQYGEDINDRDNIWRFDAFHTKACVLDIDEETTAALNSYGIKTVDNFVPNSPMTNVKHPKGNKLSSYDFYKYTACNLGNFGVTNRYIMHISNTGSMSRKFSFNLSSIAGQVYRFSQVSADGRVIYDDGGEWIMKKFDSNPAVDPQSTTEPKGRIEAPEYSDTLSFDIVPGASDTITLEIATLTGCTAPLHHTMYVE